MLEEVLAGFPRLIKFFKAFGGIGEPNKARQMKDIDQIEQFNQQRKRAINVLTHKQANRPYPNVNQYMYHVYMELTVLIHFCKEADERVLELEQEMMEDMLQLTNEVALALSTDDRLYMDVPELTKALVQKVTENKEYRKLRKMKKSIHSRIQYICSKKMLQDYAKLLSNEFMEANKRYLQDIQYSPPSIFDYIFSEYLYHSSLSSMIKPVAQVIAEADVETATCSISELALEVYDNLNIYESGAGRPIVFTSLVRLLFDEAYCIDSELHKYNKANSWFLKKCAEYSRQPVRELNLSAEIVGQYTPGLPISSLFKSKQVDMLKKMELMTNPIDLMKHVHTILVALGSYFGNGKPMSFDDTFTLLLALMSLSPPSNAASIAKFVEKWDSIQLSTVVGMSKNYFIAAIEQLLQDVDTEEEEEEEDEYEEDDDIQKQREMEQIKEKDVQADDNEEEDEEDEESSSSYSF